MKHASKALVMLATVMLLACLAPCLALAQPSEQAGAVTEPALVGGGASAALDAQDATTFTVGLKVTYGQTEARQMLDSINAFRKGSDAWYWNETDTEMVQCSGLGDLAYDYDLERIAKYRAAEIALSYSHTTLDGTSPVWDRMTGRTAKGENIAAGYTTAAAVFEGWQEADEPYSGQGHRRNMLSDKFTAVGIGHVVCNGYHYWVQEFAAPTSSAAATDADDSTGTVDLKIADSVITARSASASPGTLELAAGESADLPGVTVKIATADTWPETLQQACVQVSVPGSPGITWSSSDPSVAKVADGKVEAVAAGTATLTAAVPLGSIDSPTVAVTVVDASQAAYAILYENGDLVFQRGPTPEASRGAVVQTWTGFEAGEKASGNMWGADDYRKQVKKIVFKDKLAPVGSMAGFFNKLENAASIEGASNLDTSKVTDMSSMFSGCSSLASLDLSSWDISKVTDMRYMFSECSLLASLGISGWDTSSVASMAYMFSGCSSLTSLDLSTWNTSAATGMYAMSYMFQNCSSLKTLDVSKWNTSNVTSMYSMFSGCSKLTSLDLSKWDTSKVTDMNYMFSACLSLTSLNVSSWNTSNVTLMRQMFQYCSSLTVLDLSSWDTSKVTVMASMFYGCSKLASLSFGSTFKFAGTNASLPDVAETDAYTGKWERSSDKATATSAELMARSDLEGAWTWQKKAQDEPARSGTFGTCDWSIDEAGKLVIEPSNGVSGVLPSNAGQDSEFFPWVKAASLVKSAEIRKGVSLEGSAKRMFGNCSNLKSIDASGFDASKVTSMELMFASCTSLSSLDLSSWDTSSVTTMRSLFGGCRSLASVNLSGWDTSHVIDMEGMFAACTSLASLDLSGFDMTANPGKGGMLSECSALSTLKLGESVMLYSPNGVKYAGLPDAPSTSPYTGKWARVSDGVSVTSYELQHRTGADIAGTWVWETESGSSDDPGGSGQGGQQGGGPSGGGGSASPGDNPGGSSADPSGSSVDPGGSGQGGSTPSKPDLKQYEGTAAASGMSDLKAGEWFMDPATGAFPGTNTLYLDYTIAKGLMSGYKGTTNFGPHDNLSRAQTATILYRLAMPESKATTDPAAYEDNRSGLADVASRQYYTAAVNWCVQEGVITGYKNAQGKYTAFGPNDSVSREQLATMIFRYCTKYAKRDADTADITSFSDYGKISDWARDGVAYCVANKIVGGYTDGSGRFGPQDSAERCQMSKIIAVTAYMLE